MPRKSSAALAIVQPAKRARLRLAPSDGAPAEVAAVFDQIIRATPADHFKPSDAPLIEAYADAIVLARQAAGTLAAEDAVTGGKVNPWLTVQEKAHRALVALAGRLRLAPQSREHARTTTRRANRPPPSIYQIMREQDDADER